MDELEARIEALERAVTNDDHDLSELATEGETRERLAAVETELGDLADRVAELEAATQALRGYVGNVRAVNNDIEQRADAALAKAESLESAIAGDPVGDGPGRDRQAAERNTSGEHDSSPFTQTASRDQSAVNEPEETTAGQDRDGHGRNTDQHGRCPACGRHADRHGSDDTLQTATDASGNRGGSGSTVQAATDASGNRGGSGSTVQAATDADGRDDPLDGVFEADGGHENGDGGTFDRIREML
jgi:hypothetical protein